MNVMCFNFTVVNVTRRNSAFGIPCGQQVLCYKETADADYCYMQFRVLAMY